MSGIEEKAKTTRQIIDKCVGTNKWKLDYEITGSNAPDLTEKWVRLEDAQQEIDRLIEQRNIESGIVDRMQRERGLQKQKLEELVEELRKDAEISESTARFCGTMGFRSKYLEIAKKLEELLK